jgi:hypothetical protein
VLLIRPHASGDELNLQAPTPEITRKDLHATIKVNEELFGLLSPKSHYVGAAGQHQFADSIHSETYDDATSF